MAQPAYRIPPNLDGKADPAVVRAIQHLDRTVNQHEIAFSQLTPATTSSTTSAASSSPTVSAGVTASQASSVAVQAIQSTLGQVNAQTGTTYTTLNSDYGAIVTLDNASPVAVTLGGDGTGLQAQWWSFIQNNGAGTATLTPASGTINGAASITLITGQSVATFFDGANWWAATSIPGSGGTITDVIAGTGLNGGGASGAVTLNLDVPVSIADGGTGTASTLTGLVRGDPAAMTAAELSGDATTSGSNAITLATVNPDVGSFTSANITVNGKGLITAAANGSGSGLPINDPTFTGVMTGPQYASNSGTPTAVVGAGAGVGATVLVNGNDTAGGISLTTGTGAGTGPLATVTFTNAYPTGTFVLTNQIGASSFFGFYTVTTAAHFVLNSSVGLADLTTYVIQYIVSGY